MLGRKMREEATATDNSARISGAYSAHEREQQDGESSTGSNAAYQAMWQEMSRSKCTSS